MRELTVPYIRLPLGINHKIEFGENPNPNPNGSNAGCDRNNTENLYHKEFHIL